jgi:ABC-type multidrug transport system fused ATPase/permease subunit
MKKRNLFFSLFALILCIVGWLVYQIQAKVQQKAIIQMKAFDRLLDFGQIEPEQKFPNPKPPLTPPKGEKKWDNTEDIDELKSLQVRNLSFRFAGYTPLFHKIDFEVRKGEVVAITGESGTGKSTFLQILHQFYTFESGEICVNDTTLCRKLLCKTGES